MRIWLSIFSWNEKPRNNQAKILSTDITNFQWDTDLAPCATCAVMMRFVSPNSTLCFSVIFERPGSVLSVVLLSPRSSIKSQELFAGQLSTTATWPRCAPALLQTAPPIDSAWTDTPATTAKATATWEPARREQTSAKLLSDQVRTTQHQKIGLSESKERDRGRFCLLTKQRPLVNQEWNSYINEFLFVAHALALFLYL